MAAFSITKVQKETELIRVGVTPTPPFHLQAHFYYRSDFYVAAARADIAALLETFAEEWPRRRDANQAAVQWPEPPDDDEPVAGPSGTTGQDADEQESDDESVSVQGSPEDTRRRSQRKRAAPAPAAEPARKKRKSKPRQIAPAGLDSDVDENKLIDVKPEARQLADYRDLPPDPGPSPFAVFQDVWTRLGWSRIHLSVVAAVNRPDWFDVITRLMLERIDDANLLRRAAAAFALYTFWASQPDELEHRYIGIDIDTLDKLDGAGADCAAVLDGPLAGTEDALLPSHDLHLVIEQLHRGAPFTPAGRANPNISSAPAFFIIPSTLFHHPQLPSNYTVDGKERVRAKAAEQVLAAREELEAIISGPRPSELRVLQRALGLKISDPEPMPDAATTPETANQSIREAAVLRWEDVLQGVPQAVREDARRSRETALETFAEPAPLNDDILTRTRSIIGNGQALSVISKVLDRQLDPNKQVSDDGLPLAMRLLDSHDALTDFLLNDRSDA